MKTHYIKFALLIFCAHICSPSHSASIYYSNGLENIVDHRANANDRVTINNDTTVNVNFGGTIGETYLYDTSVLNVTHGGDVLWRMRAYDSSIVNVTGGDFSSHFHLFDSVHLTMSGGGLNLGIGTFDDSIFDFYEGSAPEAISASESKRLNF